MAERAALLLALGALAALALMAYAALRRRASVVARLDVADLGLELMAGCCAFVVFSTPSCRPCRAVLKVVRAASERSGGITEVTTIDATQRPDLAVRYSVRSVPTTFLITASGRVIRRWVDVPESKEVEAELAAL